MTQINAEALASAQTTEGLLAGLSANPDAGVQVAAADALIQQKLATAKIAVIPEPIPVPPPEKTVHSYGAKENDPSFMNNAAFQKAVASKKVIIDVPGTYWLDGLNPFDVNVSACVMQIKAPGVVLRIRPNNQSRSYVMRVSGSDCEIDLGEVLLMGDRDQHSWTYDPDGKWHEHGYGIFVKGVRNRVRGFFDDANPYGKSLITNCTGDGIGVAGPGHLIEGFVSDKNRRQGLSAFDCSDTTIQHCSFTNTGPYVGVPDPLGLIGPFAGIDIEPDKGNVTNLKILHNLIGFNRKSGLVAWIRSEVDSTIEFEAAFNKIQRNTNGAHFKDAKLRTGRIIANLHDNLFADNSAHDVRMDYGSKNRLVSNTFDRAGERTDRVRTGYVNPEMGRYGNAILEIGAINTYV